MFNKQTLRFATAGLLGALVASLIAEFLVLPAFKSQEKPSNAIPVDVAFVVDCSGSMGAEIDGVKRGLNGFVTSMNNQVGPNGEPLSLDWRVGFITIGDTSPAYKLISLGNAFLSNDAALVKKAIEPMAANQGGTEYSWDAIKAACNPGYFRDGAVKVIIMVGDEEPQGTISEGSAITALEQAGISQLHFVVGAAYKGSYERLRGSKGIPGEFEDIASVNDAAAFSKLMPKLAGSIGKHVPPTMINPEGSSEGKSNFTVNGLIKVSLVAALVAAGIALALIMVQSADSGHGYLINGQQLLLGGGGGVLAGAAAGAIAQSGFAFASSALPLAVPLIVGWAVMGGLLGGALKYLVANLGFVRGILGGLVGGGLGGLLLLMLSSGSGIMGRTLGFMAMGFCIGLMVAVAIQMMRDFWLEAYFSKDKVTRRFPLGIEPISIGSERCSVFAKGPALSFKYRMENGKVMKQKAAGSPSEVFQGDKETVGDVQLTVVAAGGQRPASKGAKETLFEAEIVANPSDPSVLGVKNNGATAWDVRVPGSEANKIAPGKSLKLVDGTRISAGGRPTLEITRSPKDPTVFGLKNLTQGPISCSSPKTSSDLSPDKSMQIHLGLKMRG